MDRWTDRKWTGEEMLTEEVWRGSGQEWKTCSFSLFSDLETSQSERKTGADRQRQTDGQTSYPPPDLERKETE